MRPLRFRHCKHLLFIATCTFLIFRFGFISDTERIDEEEVINVNGHDIDFPEKENIGKVPEKLNIHLVFHSHVDPGWLITFEQYYHKFVHKILSNTAEALVKYPQLKFIWSEVSFLERFWRDATSKEKDILTKALKEGRLEITTGSWVMMDEATPLFYSAIENLIEGHQFLRNTFGISPNTSWSVDPFGHGAMMPQLLPLSGINSMVIGRINENIKQLLRLKQTLKWEWKPMLGTGKGPRVNSLPYIIYSTHHICPDPQICACYHVGSSLNQEDQICPEDQRLDRITKRKTAQFVKRYVSQMKMLQKVYGSQDILVPVGDDFFFREIGDFDAMVTGFSTMMEYLQKHPELNVTIRFSTVSDFFNAIDNETLPKLKGDFFPYTANEPMHQWWTGFYVHRPYSKAIERRLQNSLRSLDLLHAANPNVKAPTLVPKARRDFLLFQHHDAITGTSKPVVVRDYEMRMATAQKTIEENFAKMLGLGKEFIPIRNGTTGLYNRATMDMNRLIFFSSQTFKKEHLLSFQSEIPLCVFHEGHEISTQIAKIADQKSAYTISFRHELEPLTITKFELRAKDTSQTQEDAKKKCLGFPKVGDLENLSGQHLEIEFLVIGDKGGAYAFAPYGNFTKINTASFQDHEGDVYFQRRFTYQNSVLTAEFICINDDELAINIRSGFLHPEAQTLIMRIRTKIDSSSFYTDTNGMFHSRRFYKKSLPYEANFYPVSSSAILQDDHYRLTVLTAQPTGTTSQEPGTLDILLDRRVSNNDGKGLMTDDSFDYRLPQIGFRLLVEKKNGNGNDNPVVHSKRGAEAMDSFLYSPLGIFAKKDPKPMEKLSFIWPCNIQLVLWRKLDDEAQHLVLRNTIHDQSLIHNSDCSSSLAELFGHFSTRFVLRHSSLTANEVSEVVTLKSFEAALKPPFAIASFQLKTRIT